MRDNIANLFNKFSLKGLDKEMERGHNYAVQIMLKKLKMSHTFDFLDIGCGNGWTVRKVSKDPLCRSAWGIDVSQAMIRQAKALQNSEKQRFVRTDLIRWAPRKRFDVILSMEALYYIVPVEPAINKIFYLLKKGALFLCGVDYYIENRASHSWPDKYNIEMDLRSRKEWADLFRKAGFNKVRQEKILYPAAESSEVWKQRLGTLFTHGIKK
ncbi:MAG: class I SAM-dependent methyltransferase [Nitrososphaerales archaeon]